MFLVLVKDKRFRHEANYFGHCQLAIQKNKFFAFRYLFRNPNHFKIFLYWLTDSSRRSNFILSKNSDWQFACLNFCNENLRASKKLLKKSQVNLLQHDAYLLVISLTKVNLPVLLLCEIMEKVCEPWSNCVDFCNVWFLCFVATRSCVEQ